MKGPMHGSIRRGAMVGMAGGLLLALLPGVAVATEEPLAELPRCIPAAASAASAAAAGTLVWPWQVTLDGDGAVSGHRLTLRYGSVETTLRSGPRAFALRAGPWRILVGDHSAAGTDLTMIDIGRACRLWTRRIDRLVYPLGEQSDQRSLRLSVHERDTRQYQGDLLFDVESGASGGMIDGTCTTECVPNDGDLSLSAYEPAGAPRPVPSFAQAVGPGTPD